MSKRKDAPGERISEAEHAVMEVLWDPKVANSSIAR